MNMSMNDIPFTGTDRTFYDRLFASIAEEMGSTLARTASSPNIVERRDFSCAVFDPQGRLIAQAAHIPVHLGALPLSMQAILNAVPEDGPQADDIYILNDPYAGGTHLPDITLASPVFELEKEGTLAAWLVTRAHHADVGGMSPGSLPLSTELCQEGFRIPPVRLTAEVEALLFANVRTPNERRADLRAQRAAHQTGTRRLHAELRKHRPARIARAMSELREHGRRLMEELIRQIPDGNYTHTDVLDDDGQTSEPNDDSALPINVTLTIDGTQAAVDFTGSAPACAGSLNAVEAITRSAVYYVFFCLLSTPSRLTSEHALAHPPRNAGSLEPIRVTAPLGSIVNASWPHAVAAGNVETSQRIVDTVFGAFAQALPDLIPAASQGTMNNLTVGNAEVGASQPFAYYETMGGGMGGRPGAPGLSGVQVHMTNTLNTPVEALEYAYPFRIAAYELVADTGGAGAQPGGDGLRREYVFDVPASATLITERRQHAPPGANGGEPGCVGENKIFRDGAWHPLPGKVQVRLEPGERLSIQTPGGGGFGAA